MILAMVMSIIFGVNTFLIGKLYRDTTAPFYIMFFVWTFYMVMLTIFSKYFYPLDIITAAVYWIVANCFLIGSILYNSVFKKSATNINELFKLESDKRFIVYEQKEKNY